MAKKARVVLNTTRAQPATGAADVEQQSVKTAQQQQAFQAEREAAMKLAGSDPDGKKGRGKRVRGREKPAEATTQQPAAQPANAQSALISLLTKAKDAGDTMNDPNYLKEQISKYQVLYPDMGADEFLAALTKVDPTGVNQGAYNYLQPEADAVAGEGGNPPPPPPSAVADSGTQTNLQEGVVTSSDDSLPPVTDEQGELTGEQIAARLQGMVGEATTNAPVAVTSTKFGPYGGTPPVMPRRAVQPTPEQAAANVAGEAAAAPNPYRRLFNDGVHYFGTAAEHRAYLISRGLDPQAVRTMSQSERIDAMEALHKQRGPMPTTATAAPDADTAAEIARLSAALDAGTATLDDYRRLETLTANADDLDESDLQQIVGPIELDESVVDPPAPFQPNMPVPPEAQLGPRTEPAVPFPMGPVSFTYGDAVPSQPLDLSGLTRDSNVESLFTEYRDDAEPIDVNAFQKALGGTLLSAGDGSVSSFKGVTPNLDNLTRSTPVEQFAVGAFAPPNATFSPASSSSNITFDSRAPRAKSTPVAQPAQQAPPQVPTTSIRKLIAAIRNNPLEATGLGAIAIGGPMAIGLARAGQQPPEEAQPVVNLDQDEEGLTPEEFALRVRQRNQARQQGSGLMTTVQEDRP